MILINLNGKSKYIQTKFNQRRNFDYKIETIQV